MAAGSIGKEQRAAVRRVAGCAVLGWLVAQAGCALPVGGTTTSHSATPASALVAVGLRRAVLHTSDGPGLFASAADERRPVGYVQDAEVRLVGDVHGELVEVVVEGPLEVHAFAPADHLYLRVQRRGQLRGSAAYVAPGNLVRVLGPGEKPERVRVEAVPRLLGLPLTPSAGTFPLEGLSSAELAPGAQPPEPGKPHELPRNTAVPLHERPNGDVLVVLPPRDEAQKCEVLFEQQGWSAVRLGDGPFLVGFTQVALTPSPGGSPSFPPATAAPSAGVPPALASEQGELMRVFEGTDVRFDGRVLAHLHKSGYARVLHSYPSGEVDAFVAIDDHSSVRGLVRKDRLRALDASEKKAALPHASETKARPASRLPAF